MISVPESNVFFLVTLKIRQSLLSWNFVERRTTVLKIGIRKMRVLLSDCTVWKYGRERISMITVYLIATNAIPALVI